MSIAYVDDVQKQKETAVPQVDSIRRISLKAEARHLPAFQRVISAKEISGEFSRLAARREQRLEADLPAVV